LRILRDHDPAAANAGGPLSGVLIVDFTRLIAGPCAGDVLASMGARVIKIESPEGDPMRNARSRGVERAATAPSFAAYNVLKESVILDLKDSMDRDFALDLCASADAVMASFRPGVMDRLGLGPRVMRERNPRLVIASLSAFGESGPDRDRGGVDIVLQAETGLMSVTGEAGGGPLKVGTPIVDVTSGYVLALGVVGALLGRERGSGTTEDVEVSMLDVGLHMQAQPIAEFLATGTEPDRVGNCAPYAAPADVYRASDGLLVLSAHLPAHWERLCRLLGSEAWIDDARFRHVGDRVTNRQELNAEIEAVIRQRTVADWVKLFTEAGLTAGQIRSYSDIEQSAHVAARNSIVEAVNVDDTPLRVVRSPLRFAHWDDRVLPRKVPGAGEATAKIAAEFGRMHASADEERGR
jgi:crotonobetainyl-CoA:carnitine CoA-transferase CaiB-like acyl-CoA transferase